MAVKPNAEAEARARAASEDLARQVEVLREEIQRLAGEISRAGRRSASAAGNAAADGLEALRAHGELAMDSLRDGASELEQELKRSVRERPITTLAAAAGVGLLLGLLIKR